MSPRLPEFKMIVALCRGGGIGNEGGLPWPKLARDMRFFAEMTKSSMFPYNSAVVMGRKTWESIPERDRPLPFRDNFVVSALHAQSPSPSPGVTFINNLSDIHKHTMNYDRVWLIGGASIYEQVLADPITFPVDDIFITFVDEEYEFDTAFPLMFQYDSVDEWDARKNDPANRAIWCWTDADSVPKYVSFFVNNTQLYRITDVDRDYIASITRPSDIKAIHERRVPDTVFLRARSVAHHGLE